MSGCLSMLVGCMGGNSTSYTATDSSGGTPNSDINTQFYDGFTSRFVAGSSYTLTKAQLKLRRNGTGGGGNLTAYLLSDSAGSPGSVIATSSAIAASSVSTSATLTDFTFPSGTIASGTTYWVAFLQSTGATSSGTDNIAVSYNDNTGNALQGSVNAGANWSGLSLSDLQLVFQLYKSP